jgi:hypothetical protein
LLVSLLIEQVAEEDQCRGPNIGARRLDDGDRDLLIIDADVEWGAGGWPVRRPKEDHGRLATRGNAQAGRGHSMLQRRLQQRVRGCDLHRQGRLMITHGTVIIAFRLPF